MKAYDYIQYVSNCRNSLVRLWKGVEPEFTSLCTTDILGKDEWVPCFVHPKDKDRTTIKSLRYTHREL